MSDTASTTRQRAWITTAEVCEWLGISRETLRQLRLRGVLQPGKHFRTLGLHPREGALAVAPQERGGHDHGLEPAQPPAVGDCAAHLK